MDKKLSEEYKIVCEMIDLYLRKNDKFSDSEIGELKAYVKKNFLLVLMDLINLFVHIVRFTVMSLKCVIRFVRL